ncbi:hypothetical protein GSI_08723 [Ganoderma sinense ZZ0214-1]|uniref:Uncharacterized protein n=1 Tax=Ganoderma sinense ZZ0214-1 TaxID=1077348 RepID=A0A2G8S4H1_9APHY|nr:hypothetical protein GSI_08723 [Ganoderma sinense ZZ0214-1]
MRVLDTVTGQFVEIDPRQKDNRSRPLQYAILSHTWDPKGEQTYKQLRAIQKRHTPPENDDDDDTTPTPGEPLSPIWADPKLSPKIREACRVARQNGYRYLWIDSCCIDKTSSSELSESINSMYQWYALAHVCYTFLADVPPLRLEHHRRETSRFRCSRWFTRGWTLQELIAPFRLVFLARDWTMIGSKDSLVDLITEITRIDCEALLHVEPLDEFSIAQRFSWAAERETTRVEDRAYSLLGILDINMPTLYGEGERAFRRLQEEIIRRIPDQSLFAWTEWGLERSFSGELPYNPETPNFSAHSRLQLSYPKSKSSSLLAPSLDVFRHYDFTPYGICVQLPVIHFKSSEFFPPECMDSREWPQNNVPFSQGNYHAPPNPSRLPNAHIVKKAIHTPAFSKE